MTRRHFVIALALLLLPLLQVSGLGASPLRAGCPSFPHTVPAGDVADLINSIACANASASNDVINLTTSGYELTAAYSSSTGLPPIASAATAGTLTINGNDATIARSSAGGIPQFRFIIVSYGANLTLNRVALGNGIISGGGFGGGIYNNGGTLKLTGVTVATSTAYGGGGIYNSSGSTTILRESLIGYNAAETYGGGIANAGSTLFVINSTIAGNRTLGASGGDGAINSYATGATLDIYNSTIANNSTPAPNAARSGIWVETGSLNVYNSIIANNNGANNCSFSGSSRSVNSNNIDNGTSCGFPGTYGAYTDPMLGALADNGGPTLTYALLADSPAINHGYNGDAVAADTFTQLTTDQRGSGFPRIKGGTVDIGAYEATVLQGDVNQDGVVNLTDFSILAASFGKTSGSAGYDGRADLNGDNVVNLTDFSILAANFGKTA
jgi:hypothetical protein